MRGSLELREQDRERPGPTHVSIHDIHIGRPERENLHFVYRVSVSISDSLNSQLMIALVRHLLGMYSLRVLETRD